MEKTLCFSIAMASPPFVSPTTAGSLLPTFPAGPGQDTLPSGLSSAGPCDRANLSFVVRSSPHWRCERWRPRIGEVWTRGFGLRLCAAKGELTPHCWGILRFCW